MPRRRKGQQKANDRARGPLSGDAALKIQHDRLGSQVPSDLHIQACNVYLSRNCFLSKHNIARWFTQTDAKGEKTP